MKTGKRIISVLLSVIMALGVCAAAPFTASAEFYTADGIKWCYEVLEDGTSVRIVYGSEPADPDAGSISGSITIPRSFYLDDGNVYTVTEIENAFNSTVVYGGITSVTIPDTVKKIGVRAFQNMTNLTSVSFGEGSALTTIGVNAFNGCKNLSSITIPQGVKTIDNYAFYDCESLSSVVIPDNVTTFGNYVFRNCKNLQSAVIGANVPLLNGTFISCGNLESVTFSSNSVTDFSGYTFYGCGSLTSITIPCNFDKAKFTSGSSYINVNDVGDTFTVQETPASGTFSYTHNYGEPVWNWDDVSHPTYTEYCAGCGAEKTGEADSVTVTHNDPDGAVPGYTEAKASVVIDGETYESTHIAGALEITNYAQLKTFAARVNSGETNLSAMLMNDIICKNSPDDTDYANDWTPIGDYDNQYTGTFDGLGHKITGLTYNNPQQNYAGLFGYVGTKTEGGVTTKGTVKNVGLEGGSVSGKDFAGGVAGRNDGTVTGCYNTGGVSGKDYVGGVVGENSGNSSVENCYNTGSVTATGDSAYVGGVVGANLMSSTISNCYNTGSVTATEQNAHAGGVTGDNYNNSSVENCYNTGSVTAIGQFADAGGVVGYNYMSSTISNCYNTGSVTATGSNAYAGGVAGENFLENSSVKNCCYDSDRAPGIPAIGYENTATHTNVEGLTTAQMTGANALDNMVFEYGAGEENPWQTRANDDINSFYPHLKGFAYDSEPTAENWPPKIVNVIEYPLWVGGNQVTSANMDSLDALDGIAVSDGGSVKFVPDADGKGGTLYLNNATITGTQSYKSGGTHDSNILVENKEFNITINLEGENTLGPAERGIWMVNNSASSGLALTGDGKLSITAEKNGILINCDLLIDGADINVTATGGDSGGTGIIADDIDIINSSVYAEGTGDQYDIFCASALTISDSSVESRCTGTYGRGLYFSDEENFTVSGDSFVTLEGGTRYGALWIKGSLITENGNEIVEPANYIIDPLETGSDVYLVYDVSTDEKIPAVKVIITNPLTITVTANPTGGGTITGGGKTYKGADVALTAAPETGYDFVSWTEGASVVSTNAKYSFTVEQSRNLVANFKLQVKSVSVSANLPDGGTVSGAGTYNYGENATVTALSKDHYSFVNWTENGAEVSTNAKYSFPVTGDRNLVANFAKDKHTVEFVNDDGAGLQSVQVPYGETPAYTGEKPTKEATAEYTYTFAGWSPEISEVTGDATYTATYTETPIDYKLTWKVDGESYKNETIPFGGNITLPDVEAKEGYTFAWVDEIPATMPAQDVTINGKFTVIEYTATFVNENGETVEAITFTVETESITEPDVPEKTGYAGEWEEYTLGTSDITIKPVYANITSVQIENYEENSEIGYKEDVTYTADASDLPEGAEIHWFVNGEDVGTGESYTVEDPTDDYNIYAEVIDKDGNTLDTTKVQSVKVKNGFFDRLKAFFAELIEKILGKAIIDILTSIC